MLVDVDFHIDPIIAMFMDGPSVKRHAKGIYLHVGHNFSNMLDDDWQRDYSTNRLKDIAREKAGTYVPDYGVCDSPEQFIERFGKILEDDVDQYAVGMTLVRKADQSPDGGWRWHKWGEYIGIQQRDGCEYLYDESHVNEVWCFSVERKRK